MMKQWESKAEHLPERSVLSAYDRPQPEGLMAVREYVITSVDGARCLLLRWVREADFSVDDFTFEVDQMDALGDWIRTVTVTYGGMDIPPVGKGEAFVPTRGIEVDEACTDIRIRLTELVSDRYVYTVHGNRVDVSYRAEEPWSYDPEGGREDGLSDAVQLQVRSLREGRARWLWPAAVLAALLLVLVILFPYIPREKEHPPIDRNDPPAHETGRVAIRPQDGE